MPWLKLDDGFAEHQKVQKITDRAFRLHVAGMLSCARRLTDGRLTELDVDVCRIVANRATAKHVEELEEAGLWKRDGGAWVINDFLEYNPPAEKVKAERKASAERQRRHRERTT